MPICPPSWDLEVVFRAQCGGEFGPMADISFRAHTKKVLFLLDLATVKRVSELHTVPSHVAFQENDIVLCYLPGLRATTEMLSNPLPWTLSSRL